MSDDAYTTNGYFELPGLGKKGESERQLFNAGLERVDSALGVQVGNVGFEDLDTALTAIGSAKTVLRFRNVSTTISTDTTIPTNVTLAIPIGALLAVATGVTLTINGPLEVGPYQIFSCTGTGKVLFGPGFIDQAYAAWWGAKGDYTTDNTAAIQAAINAMGNAGGGKVKLLSGYHKITGPLSIGDGSDATWSTYDGLTLEGQGTGWGATSPCTVLDLQFSSGKTGIQVLGPMRGWGIKDLMVNGANSTGPALGVYLQSAQNGCMENVYIIYCENAGLELDAGTTETCSQNSFRNVAIWMAATGSSLGLGLLGNDSSNSCFNSFYDLHIIGSSATQVGISLQACDSNQFFNTYLYMDSSATGIQFDYTQKTGGDWPSGNKFFGLDTSQTAIDNAGSPGSGAQANAIYGFSTVNGSQSVYVENLFIYPTQKHKARMYLDGAQSIGNSPTDILLDTKDYDTGYPNSAMVNIAAHSIVAEATGWYRAFGQMTVASYSGASAVYLVLVNTDGVDLSKAWGSNNGVVLTLSTQTTVWLESGKGIYMKANISGGSTALTTGKINTFLELEGPL